MVYDSSDSCKSLFSRGLIDRFPSSATADINDHLLGVNFNRVDIPREVDHNALGGRIASGTVATTLDSKVQLVFARVLNTKRDVLLVFDERDDLSVSLSTFGPSTNSTLIVWMSRSNAVALERCLEGSKVKHCEE